jgi:hypothetical protein
VVGRVIFTYRYLSGPVVVWWCGSVCGGVEVWYVVVYRCVWCVVCVVWCVVCVVWCVVCVVCVVCLVCGVWGGCGGVEVWWCGGAVCVVVWWCGVWWCRGVKVWWWCGVCGGVVGVVWRCARGGVVVV